MGSTGKRVILVDPESRDPVACLRHRENGDEGTWTFSIKWKNRTVVARRGTGRTGLNNREGSGSLFGYVKNGEEGDFP